MTDSGSLLIGVIDDDQSVRDSLVTLVECFGHRSVAFSTAEEYLNSDVASSVDFIIVDLGLPGISRTDLLNVLSDSDHGCRAVVIAGHGDSDELQRASRFSSVRFLSKPIDPESLLAIIGQSGRDHSLTATALR